MSHQPVDPSNAAYHGTALWMLYGQQCSPSIACVQLVALATGKVLAHTPAVGGAVPSPCLVVPDVSQVAGGYGPLFYLSQDAALEELRRRTWFDGGAAVGAQ